MSNGTAAARQHFDKCRELVGNDVAALSILDACANEAQEYAEQAGDRKDFLTEYEVGFGATVCMDGRLSAKIAGLPRGAWTSWKAGGAECEIGYAGMSNSAAAWAAHHHAKYRLPVMFHTYHHSKSGGEHNNCKWFGGDTEKAKSTMRKQRKQYEEVLSPRGVINLLMGIETDHQAMTFHGLPETTKKFSVRRIVGEKITDTQLAQILAPLYPNSDPRLVRALVQLAKGNAEQIARVMQNPDIETAPTFRHSEHSLCFGGESFDWLTSSNTVIAVGSYIPMWITGLTLAAGILLQNNLDPTTKKLNRKGTLLVSVPFRESVDRKRMACQARYLAMRACQAITAEYRGMASDYFSVLVGTFDFGNRWLHPIAYYPSMVEAPGGEIESNDSGAEASTQASAAKG